MNLNFSNFQMLLESFLQENSCLSTGSDEVLFVKTKIPVLIGTLPEAAKNTKRYLQLDAGDIVLLNDPYSGGGLTNEFTFVVITQAFAVPLYYSVKKTFGPLKKPAEHIDKEGLRITPTPILQKGEVNKSILEAIETLPTAPLGFKNWVLLEISQLQLWAQRFEKAISHCRTRSSKSFIKDFLEHSKNKTEQILHNYSSFDTKQEYRKTKDEILKLDIQFKDNRFNLDWSAGPQFMGQHFTESQVFGICTEVLLSTFKVPYRNSGSFSCIRVVKPHTSFLNSKYPAPMMRGLQEGVDLLQMAIESCLSQLSRQQFPLKINAPSLFFHCSNRVLQWDLQLAGDPHALPFFEPEFSIENLEKKLPVLIEKCGFRNQTASHQTQDHGAGLSLKIQFLKDLSISIQRLQLPLENYFNKHRVQISNSQLQWNDQDIPNDNQEIFKKEAKPGDSILLQTAVAKF